MGKEDGAQDPYWSVSLYPTAGEAGGSLIYPVRSVRSFVARGKAADPDRAAQEAGRRARGKLRRYCAANRLNRLGTLTYAGEGCHDPVAVRAHVGVFFRELRTSLGGDALPYVWVPEWHKTGHGLHVHFAVGRYVKRGLIDDAWGHGFVHIKLLSNGNSEEGPLGQARRAAGYLSKYVTKTFLEPESRVLGLHRYDVAQGFQPERVRLFGPRGDRLIERASDSMGAQPIAVWFSTEAEEWQGPPALWAQWGGRG